MTKTRTLNKLDLVKQAIVFALNIFDENIGKDFYFKEYLKVIKL